MEIETKIFIWVMFLTIYIAVHFYNIGRALDKIIDKLEQSEKEEVMADIEYEVMDEFKIELEGLINKHCIENYCDVPDFILAEMIVDFITTQGYSIKKTLDWHGCDSTCHPLNKQKEGD